MEGMFDLSLLGSESVRPIRRVEYERFVASGVFGEENLELLHGVLFRMSPQGTLHADAIAVLHQMLVRALGERAAVRSHSPFAANDLSLPEPDLAVVSNRRYTDAHPSEAFLIVEAADSSLTKDRQIKAPLYASNGVAEYWILDLEAPAIEVHRLPTAGAYASVARYERGAAVPLAGFPDVSIRVSDVLPPAS